MRWLWQDVRTHRRAAAVFLAWWLAIWGITLGTWLFSASGETIGMHPLAIVLNLILPFTAGALVRWWRLASTSRATRLLHSAVAGLLVMEVNWLGELLVWLLLYHVILGRPLLESGGLLGGLAEYLQFSLISGIFALLLGALGGIGSGLLAGWVRLIRG